MGLSVGELKNVLRLRGVSQAELAKCYEKKDLVALFLAPEADAAPGKARRWSGEGREGGDIVEMQQARIRALEKMLEAHMHDAPQSSSPAAPTGGGVRHGGAGRDAQGTEGGGGGGAMSGELQEARAQVEMLKGKVALLEQQAREREVEREREMQQRLAQVISVMMRNE